jgi:hypothetical protein
MKYAVHAMIYMPRSLKAGLGIQNLIEVIHGHPEGMVISSMLSFV